MEASDVLWRDVLRSADQRLWRCAVLPACGWRHNQCAGLLYLMRRQAASSLVRGPAGEQSYNGLHGRAIVRRPVSPKAFGQSGAATACSEHERACSFARAA